MLYPMAFYLLYPITVTDCNEVMIELAGLDVIPSETIQSGVFEFEEEEPPIPRLDELGYGSPNFALNCGTSLIFFQMQLLLMIVYFGLEMAQKYYCKETTWPKRTRKKIRDFLFWNAILDFLNGAQIEMQLGTII